MCIGIALRVIEAWPGAALAEGRGRRERIDTRLVGDVSTGQWLLVFQGAARERLDAARAAEIDAALDLLDAALAGDHAVAAADDPGFELPSRWSAAQLAALAGHASTGGPSGDSS
ncbi:MAG: HypC/HybG/HupF family hydrogenase formation chaperone [Burkholderiaceae bacterium]